MRILGAAFVTFLVALLVNVPVVFVWNLFWNGQGTVDWGASIAIAVTIAFVFPIVIATRNAIGHTRQQ
jgi:hypothetical protein